MCPVSRCLESKLRHGICCAVASFEVEFLSFCMQPNSSYLGGVSVFMSRHEVGYSGVECLTFSQQALF